MSGLEATPDPAALVVAACGSYGSATRRDLSSWVRTLFSSLVGLIAFGFVAFFVSIPIASIRYGGGRE
jgi:FtsH-binding integral membrane protein